MTRRLSVSFISSLALLLTACPDTGIVCRAGTNRCGSGCADYTADNRNCGACGQACAGSQVCDNAVCRCQDGTESCGGQCVVKAYDSANCGDCGRACASGEVCELGLCKAACSAGTSVRCGNSCIDTQVDVMNCGACGAACQAGQSCRKGACVFELVAACFSTGQLTGFQTSGTKGPTSDFGTAPATLAAMNGVLLGADGIDRKLYQATLPLGASAYAQVARSNKTGAVPNAVLVDAPYVYVVNAESGTLQVLQQGASSDAGDVELLDGGVSGGLELATIAELPLGMNTYPQAAARIGKTLWIPLYGGYGDMAAAAGQKVLKVSVADPLVPTQTGSIDLSSLDLHAFDGGTPVARPWAIVSVDGGVVVAMNNLDPSTYVPGGPGLLARIDAVSDAVSLIDLGGECLNPQALAKWRDGYVVSCGGAADYSGPNYSLAKTDNAGVALVQNDAVTARWSPRCPAGSMLEDGGTTCAPFLPGKIAVAASRIFVADQNAGRVVVLDVDAGVLVEARGPVGEAPAMQVCAPSAVTGLANVADVFVTP